MAYEAGFGIKYLLYAKQISDLAYASSSYCLLFVQTKINIQQYTKADVCVFVCLCVCFLIYKPQ